MYHSPTYGKLDSLQLKKRIAAYMEKVKGVKYRVIVGSDSQRLKKGGFDFVVAIAIHRVGAGGIYFWRREIVDRKMSLRQRMYHEAILSLQSAENVFELLRQNGIAKYEIEVHVDIGRVGETREMINEIVAMVRSNGYQVKIKPDAFGASKVADRHT